MTLYGIQLPDPVALMGFSGIIPITEHHVLCNKGRHGYQSHGFVSGNARRQLTSEIFASSSRSDGHLCVHYGHALFHLRTVCHIGYT